MRSEKRNENSDIERKRVSVKERKKENKTYVESGNNNLRVNC